MRIDSYITNVAADCQAARASKPHADRGDEVKREVEDTVVLRSAQSPPGDARAEKVERLRMAVQSGTYEPPADSVAKAVLAELIKVQK